METTINWAKLVAQNRVKAPGVNWTEEDQKALDAGISPDDVRAGILTKEEEQEYQADPRKRLTRLKKPKLVEMAKELGVEIADENAVTREFLIDAIWNIQQRPKEDTPEKPEEPAEPEPSEPGTATTEGEEEKPKEEGEQPKE